MATPLLRPLGFGEILDGAFALYRRNFRDLVLTAFVPFVPYLALGLLFLLGALYGSPDAAGLLLGLFVFLALSYALGASLLIWTALAHQFSAAMLGEPLGWRAALREGLAQILPVAGASFLFVVALSVVGGVGGMVAVFGFAGAAIASGADGPGPFFVLMPLMMAAIFAPLVFIFVSLALYVPAIVNERSGAVESLGRSWTLMKGARLRGLGLWAIGWLIVLVPSLLLIGFLSLIFGLGATLGLEDAEGATVVAQVMSQLAQPFVGALTTPFTVALLVLLYFDRRVRAEGLDLQLAEAEMEGGDPVVDDASGPPPPG